ncbi:hypothetical protein [Dyadobacter sp.]|uniref:hypothetical protein n=1 Tax=Dyadobacter sp. TaxID=1914288 RepID=UPI003F709E43
MEFYRCLDSINPTNDQLMLWAYDLDLYLTDQDEDLVLHSNQYIATLFQLACDDNCPKKDYCFSILKHHFQHLLAKRDIDQISEAMTMITEVQAVADANARGWLADLFWISALIKCPRRLNFEEMQKIASFIIGTDNEIPTLTTVSQTGYLHFEQSFELYKDHLYIHQSTSDWKYSHITPVNL